MAEDKRVESFSEAAYVPVHVVDNESYVKLNGPSEPGFSNTSKSINDINTAHTHHVVDYYKRSF